MLDMPSPPMFYLYVGSNLWLKMSVYLSISYSCPGDAAFADTRDTTPGNAASAGACVSVLEMPPLPTLETRYLGIPPPPSLETRRLVMPPLPTLETRRLEMPQPPTLETPHLEMPPPPSLQTFRLELSSLPTLESRRL